jgi:hypothetical protein
MGPHQERDKEEKVKLEVNEKYEITLKEVFSGVGFISPDGEEFGICMRDSGFEFTYEGRHFEAKEGELRELTTKLVTFSPSDNGGEAPKAKE